MALRSKDGGIFACPAGPAEIDPATLDQPRRQFAAHGSFAVLDRVWLDGNQRPDGVVECSGGLADGWLIAAWRMAADHGEESGAGFGSKKDSLRGLEYQTTVPGRMHWFTGGR